MEGEKSKVKQSGDLPLHEAFRTCKKLPTPPVPWMAERNGTSMSHHFDYESNISNIFMCTNQWFINMLNT